MSPIFPNFEDRKQGVAIILSWFQFQSVNFTSALFLLIPNSEFPETETFKIVSLPSVQKTFRKRCLCYVTIPQTSSSSEVVLWCPITCLNLSMFRQVIGDYWWFLLVLLVISIMCTKAVLFSKWFPFIKEKYFFCMRK